MYTKSCDVLLYASCTPVIEVYISSSELRYCYIFSLEDDNINKRQRLKRRDETSAPVN